MFCREDKGRFVLTGDFKKKFDDVNLSRELLKKVKEKTLKRNQYLIEQVLVYELKNSSGEGSDCYPKLSIESE